MNLLGVIVCTHAPRKFPPFAESSYFKQLSIVGKQLGIDIIIFSPKMIDWQKRTVYGWCLKSKTEWSFVKKPLPSFIYDRCYYLNQKHYFLYRSAVQKIKNDPQIRLLGRALGGKYQTHQILQKSPYLTEHLPQTLLYQNAQDVVRFCHTHGAVLIKPNGGSHGTGVVAIRAQKQGYHLQGRSRDNRSFSYYFTTTEQLKTWIMQFVQGARYILQPLLCLQTGKNEPFDLRILVQKNEQSEWETTGMAIRVGRANNNTSNLHGGGQAYRLRPFLNQNYPQEQAEKIVKKIHEIASIVPTHIEKHHGPLIELGLDIGIDRDAQVWILEVNSKPGRTIFLRTGEIENRRRSILLPLRYAHSLLTGQVGGSNL